MSDNLPEALRYYEHALNVVRNCSDCLQSDLLGDLTIEQVTLLSDQAKIHVSIAQILRTNQDFPLALNHFKKAVVSDLNMSNIFKQECLSLGAEVTPETNQIMLEAKKAIL